ncbi:MAG: ubiquinol-cytochrome c reductase iron-sulfur subunit [Haloarculaceae archaeon]
MSTDTRSDDSHSETDSRRRRLLTWLGGLSVVSFAVGLVTPLKDLALAVQSGTAGSSGGGSEGGSSTSLAGQTLVFAKSHEGPDGSTHSKGDPITPDALGKPDDTMAFPKDHTGKDHYLINLHKLEADKLADPTKTDWTDQGLVAYSAICTHLGCAVNWHPGADGVGHPFDHCPCHGGEYDPYKGAKVISGPPPRPTPQIGVKVNGDNHVQLTSDFEGPVGSQ